MTNLAENSDNQSFQRNMMTSFIQIAALVVLVSYCVIIVGPFAGLVIWGVILAVAIYPVHLKLSSLMGGSQKLAVTLFIAVGLAVILIPGWVITESAITSIMSFATEIKSGSVHIPPPSQDVAQWPLVGERLYAAWSGAAENLQATLNEFHPQLMDLSEWLARKIGSMAIGILQIGVSIIIAGVAMLYATSGYKLGSSIATRISADRGQHWTDMSISTIRSVTNGVLGVAVIQALLAAIGFFLMGVPHAGLLTALVLITSIIQVPALLIIAPIVVWVFSFADPLPATLFAIYSLLVALSDNVLKPILLGRGVDLPAVVVLIGAIGGMIEYGIVGLFLGAVILGLGYTIISDWLQTPGDDSNKTDAGLGG